MSLKDKDKAIMELKQGKGSKDLRLVKGTSLVSKRHRN